MYEPIKSLGQNFLIDRSVAREMVEALEIKNGDEIVEIGPGHGALTEVLAEKVRDTDSLVRAVEIDERFFEKLMSLYAAEKNIKLVKQDILTWLPTFFTDKELKVIGSLPYYITSPIIHSIIKMQKRPSICVVLVQKEVAERIKSKAPDSSYMSCFVQTFFDVDYLGKVPRNRFKPEPAVDGGIIKMKRRDGDVTAEFIKRYEGFLHRAFSSPRKMVNKVFTQTELAKGGIEPTLRAQNLDADQWLKFYQTLYEI